jgi:Thioredoxin-like [2Fe-2S] ferredoxin
MESRFETAGEFVRFIRTLTGKRRLILRDGQGGEVAFKVPRELRHAWADRLQAGMKIILTGETRQEWGRGELKRIVSDIRQDGAPEGSACDTCSVRICAKKNCWKSGGKELYAHLERKIAEAGIADRVHLKAVGCLDHCKHAPNLSVDGRIHEHCRPSQLDALCDRIAARHAAAREEVI